MSNSEYVKDKIEVIDLRVSERELIKRLEYYTKQLLEAEKLSAKGGRQ